MASGKAGAVIMAARSLMEGAPADFELLALLSGRTVSYFERIAGREGWKIRETSQESLVAFKTRLSVLITGMVDEIEKLGFSALGGQYDKPRLEALTALLKIVERLDGVVRGTWYSVEKEKKDDEELATALALVDARIVELACELAASMGGEASDGGGGGTRPA